MYLFSTNPGCSAFNTPFPLYVAPSPCFCTIAAAGNGLHP
jgi:hypothetical protein